MEKNIHTAILDVMKEVKYLQKERKAEIKYTVKSEEGVIKLLRPAMIKHDIIMYPCGVKDVFHSEIEVGKYKNIWQRMVVTHCYKFVHAESGTSIDVEVIGEGADTSDKAGNKTMTVSKKYALLETFLLITGDDPDDTPSPDGSSEKQTRNWSRDQLQAVVNTGAAKAIPHAKNILESSNLISPNDGAVWCKWYGENYLKAKESGLESADAAKRVNILYTKTMEKK